ncbi:MAG: hypothetical protein ACLQU5_33040 [Isosphaeraceae bacterium]
MAEAQAEALRLPLEYTENLVKDLAAHRAIAGDRLAWCRHIALLQNLGHEGLPSTLYRDEPEHLCICILHRYRSPSGSTDWFGLIEAFKTGFCHGCGDRSPGTQGLDQRPVN